MFSNTAYEAMYQYLGLSLHSKFIEAITSQKVFLGMILMIFGFMFFLTAAQFFSRYIPGVILTRKHVPLSKFFKIVCLLFLGLSILKVGSETGVKRFNGASWHGNPYVHSQMQEVKPQYQVSMLFDLMSRSAEEVAAFLARIIDQLFQTAHSQLEAPNFFFKAMMYGAASTIEDPHLNAMIRNYTDECFDRMLPMVGELKGKNKLDGFFADHSTFNQKLSELDIPTTNLIPYTCLDLKNELTQGLKDYAISRPGIGKNLDQYLNNNIGMKGTSWENYQVSNLLVNQYTSEHETFGGIQKGSQMPTTGGRIIQYFNKLTGFDGLLSVFSGGQLQGAWVAANRSQEFSENLARAPHVAGFIKMLLIAAFPWLLFVVVAGYWRVLIYWWLLYFSVLLWTPIWTLLYHVMTSIALSAETMQAIGKLGDGVSLYGASLVSSRMYHLFAVYAWLQLLTGTLFTGMLMYFLRPALSDTESDSAPDAAPVVMDGAGKLASKATTVAKAFV